MASSSTLCAKVPRNWLAVCFCAGLTVTAVTPHSNCYTTSTFPSYFIQGWKLTKNYGSKQWNVAWHDRSLTIKEIKTVESHQRVNHFPGIIDLNRKCVNTISTRQEPNIINDILPFFRFRMATALNEMLVQFPTEYVQTFLTSWPQPLLLARSYGDAHSFETVFHTTDLCRYRIFPDSWCLPREMPYFRKLFDAGNAGNDIFIIKPDKVNIQKSFSYILACEFLCIYRSLGVSGTWDFLAGQRCQAHPRPDGWRVRPRMPEPTRPDQRAPTPWPQQKSN